MAVWLPGAFQWVGMAGKESWPDGLGWWLGQGGQQRHGPVGQIRIGGKRRACKPIGEGIKKIAGGEGIDLFVVKVG